MKILTALTYYRPHTSGLTIYAERLAEALVRRGHEVTVLTAHFDPGSPKEETVNGVHIVRVPVMFRVNKGVIMPTIGYYATREALRHDVILLHLPQFDAAGMALRGRLFRKPTAILYHCDLLLPPGAFNKIVNRVVLTMNDIAGRFAHKVIGYTEDFACHSPFLTKFEYKREIITPPVQLPEATPDAVHAFKLKHNPEGRPVIGMATRFASEKGVGVLIDALPKVLDTFPNAKVLYAGQYKNVWGEEQYFEQLRPKIERLQAEGRWAFLGVLTLAQMAEFFPNLDVLVVPSLNSTETFGFVQIEAMMNGTPAIAANLPGVRQPVTMTGMGRVVPIGDSPALADAIIDVLTNPDTFAGDPKAIKQMFAPETNALAFERMFEAMLRKMGKID